MKKFNTPEEVEAEIERLQNNEYVKLARKNHNNTRRQIMYNLRSLEKKGMEIAGVTK